MNASNVGWCATYNGHAASGFWTGPQLLWHINCLELLAVLLALWRSGRCCLASTCWSAWSTLRPFCTSTGRVVYDHVACHNSPAISKSLRAVHILVIHILNRAADVLSRQLTFPGEWRLHPETIRLFWSRLRETQVNLVASHVSCHGQLYDSLTKAPSARTHWCTAGLGLYASMCFPQWAFSHRHVAAITAHHDAVDGRFLGKQDLIVRFLRGARRLHRPRPPLVPSWDLSIVLAGLQRGPVELLESVRASEALSSFCLLQRLAEREGCLQAEVGPLDIGCHRLGVPIPRRAVPPGGEGSLHTECCLLLCIGTQRLSGRHLQSCGLGDTLKTFSALSQSLPLCWVTGKWWEELASVTLAAPFLLTRGCERLFPPPVSSPDGEPWWSSSSTPRSQTGWSSLTPGGAFSGRLASPLLLPSCNNK